VHGGLPVTKDLTLREINSINRRQPVPFSRGGIDTMTRSEEILQGLLWSDPRDIVDGSDWKPSVRGAGVEFSAGLTLGFLESNGLKKLIRSHELCGAGYATHHQGLTTTVFSASNYCGFFRNYGCHLVVHPSLELEFREHTVLPGSLAGLRSEPDGKFKQLDLEKKDDEWLQGAKDESLGLLRHALFAKRQQLLQGFEVADEQRTGFVKRSDWVRICRACIHPKLPWWALSHHLIAPDENPEWVAYMPFLERFQNRLTHQLMRDWANKVAPLIAQRLLESGLRCECLSYQELCDEMREEFPGFEQRSIYYLLMVLCPTGSLDPASIKLKAMQLGSDHAPCGVDLWTMSAFRAVEWGDFKEAWLEMSCPTPGGFDDASFELLPSLVRADFVKLCLKTFSQVGKESKQRWEVTAGVLDKHGTGLVEWIEVEALVDGFDLEWRKASRVLDILATAARVHISLQGLFKYIDEDGDGVVSHYDFHRKVNELVGVELDLEEKDSIWGALDSKNDGKVSLSDVVAALDVVDTLPAKPANDSLIAAFDTLSTDGSFAVKDFSFKAFMPTSSSFLNC